MFSLVTGAALGGEDLDHPGPRRVSLEEIAHRASDACDVDGKGRGRDRAAKGLHVLDDGGRPSRG